MKPVGDGAKRVRVGAFISKRGKAPVKVSLDIKNVLKAYGDPNQALPHTRQLALRGSQTAMRGTGRMGQEGLGVAQIGAK